MEERLFYDPTWSWSDHRNKGQDQFSVKYKEYSKFHLFKNFLYDKFKVDIKSFILLQLFETLWILITRRKLSTPLYFSTAIQLYN